ncbi:MAG: BatD family protein [Fusobacteriaceae bacterium]
MNKIKLLLIFIFVNVLSFGAITMYTNTNKIQMNEGVEVTIEFVDTEKGNYVIEGLDDFEIISKNSSSYFSSVNFKSSKKLIDKYILKPSKLGELLLEVRTDKEKSNQIKIEVTNQYDNKTEENIDISKENTQLEGTKYYFLKNNLENKTLYFGQKSVYEEDFIVLKQFRGFEYRERPVFTDISIKDYSKSGNQFQREINADGVAQFRLNLFSGIFQGNSSGKKIIKSAKIEVTDDRILYLGGKNIAVEIIPLPEGKIKSYRDIVGDLKLESNWTDSEIEIGKTVTLNIRLYGEVNLDNIKTIDIQRNSEYNIFETVKNEILEVREGKVYSEKDFEIAFVPKKSGEIVVPSIKIGYFNTKTKKYEEKIIAEQRINVKPNSEVIENNISENKSIVKEEVIQKEEIKKNTDVSFKFLEKIEENKNITFINIILVVIVILEGILIFYLLLKGKKKKEKEINSLKDFEKIKTQDEFYKIYCEYMKKYYDFNPNAHSESRLNNNILIEINRIMEGYKYEKKDFNMKEIIEKLKIIEEKK